MNARSRFWRRGGPGIRRDLRRAAGWSTAVLVAATSVIAQEAAQPLGTCDPEAMPGAVWWGTDQSLTAHRLASYAAPVIWFSWEEPSLAGAEAAEIRHPEPFTFEPPADGPVLYYQIRDIQVRESAETSEAFQRDEEDFDASRIDLRPLVGLDVAFYAYYQRE